MTKYEKDNNEKENIEKQNIEQALAEEKRGGERQTLLRQLWRIGKSLEAEAGSLDRTSTPTCCAHLPRG